MRPAPSARLRADRRELIDPKIGRTQGRIVKTTGDGLLVEFPRRRRGRWPARSPSSAAWQSAMEEIPDETADRIPCGINLGDIIIAEDNDIHGDGVNVAARLEALAETGGV